MIQLLVGITGFTNKHWQSKLKEINKYKIKTVSLFLERFEKEQREQIYKALLKSKIKQIPLVHIRSDMSRDELVFLNNNYNSEYFTIHEDHFMVLPKWKGFYKKLYLEMNTDDYVSKKVNVNRIGGFCVDLSHFKVEQTKQSMEYDYTIKRKKVRHYFKCNHLNGYSPEKNTDLHVVRNFKEFDYLRTLPKFVFGQVIGIEMDNSISEQLVYRKYLLKVLNGIIYDSKSV